MAKKIWKNDNVLKSSNLERTGFIRVNIPEEMKEAIEKELTGIKYAKVIEEAQKISERYRKNDGKGKKIVTKQSEAVAYAISRMPSTYCAVYSALVQSLKNYDKEIKKVLDVGAGTGAATWAIENLINANQITCLEREKEMRNIGSKLMERQPSFQNVKWQEFDLIKDEITEKADLVVTSYVINELTEEDRKKAIAKIWDATNQILLIIEPGTPEGFEHILEARESLLKEGANIIAPCAHQNKCAIGEDDWCSFYVRVARSGIQRQAKKGELGYEDEKFSYIAFSRTPIKKCASRILRHPQINQGHVKVKLCTENGIEEKVYSKKDGEVYKRIRKMDAGEII